MFFDETKWGGRWGGGSSQIFLIYNTTLLNLNLRMSICMAECPPKMQL